MTTHRALAALALSTLLLPSALLADPVASPLEALLRAKADAEYVQVRSFFRTRLTRLSQPTIEEVSRTIVHEAERARLDPGLVIALIQVESSGNPLAISSVGALGLMQLRPSTAQMVAAELDIPFDGEDDLFEPAVNVRLGVAYLGKLIRRFGELDTALAAYNWGPTRISRMLREGGALPVRYTRSIHREIRAIS